MISNLKIGFVLAGIFILGLLIGIMVGASPLAKLYNDYPVIDCIFNLEGSLNPEVNGLPFTPENQRATIQWRCAKEYVDFNASYEDMFGEVQWD